MNIRILLKRMARSKLFMIGFILTVFIILTSIFAGQLAPHDPLQASLRDRLTPPQWFSQGRAGYILGTDQMGRCVLSRLLIGSQISLKVAFTSTLLMVVIGTALGMMAGYFGGILDQVVMRACEVTMTIPAMTLGVVIMAIFGASITNLILVMVICMWKNFAKIARNDVMVIRNKEYIQASRALGAKRGHIIFTQILPNITTPLLIQLSQTIGGVILTEASLSFLYLGIQAPNPSWGNMISNGREYLSVAPWLVLAPGLMLMITVLAFNFLGDGLRDILDPKQVR